jgi:hypothetical protein
LASLKCNPKRATPSINFVDADLELTAEQLENGWLDGRAKLAEQLPALQQVRAYFAANRGRAMLRGCRTWGEFARRRLRVTPQAVHICIKRLNLTAAQREVAAEQAKEQRRLRRWEAGAEQMMQRTEFARARNDRFVQQMAEKQAQYEASPQWAAENEELDRLGHDDADRVVPAHHVHALLSALEQTKATLDRIAISGLIAPDLELLAATKRCAASAAKVAADVRKELGIGDGKAKVVNIADRVQ